MNFGDLNDLLHAIRMRALGAAYACDPGDEHRDAAVIERPRSALDELLDDPEFTRGHEVAGHTMEMILLAEAHRHCCHACALEVNGEDGS